MWPNSSAVQTMFSDRSTGHLQSGSLVAIHASPTRKREDLVKSYDNSRATVIGCADLLRTPLSSVSRLSPSVKLVCSLGG